MRFSLKTSGCEIDIKKTLLFYQMKEGGGGRELKIGLSHLTKNFKKEYLNLKAMKKCLKSRNFEKCFFNVSLKRTKRI